VESSSLPPTPPAPAPALALKTAIVARPPAALPEPPELRPTDTDNDDKEEVRPPAAPVPEGPAPRVAKKGSTTAERSLTRTLGLKIRRVVLDPGHGGHDHGTTGHSGLIEKELVLDVTRRLGVLLEQNMGCEVIYTRTTDVFLSLEQRAALANQKKADLFLSVHANSSPLRTAAGTETYYLSFTTSKADMEVAARENASSERSISELRDLVSKIALREKADESREFAAKIQSSLAKVSFGAQERRNRGVKRAPFVVLVGASMPAVLTEIGFVTNSKEEAQMKKPEFRQRLAEGIFKGIEQYADSLGQMHVAQKAAGGGSEE
jgi:N-acetylmuramoyl-L-alanine amidase